jgi:hypothetical protein
MFIAAALLHGAALSIAAEEDAPPGCRLAADDPLRDEVDRMMKQGAEFEQQQRLALEEKVNVLARARGWSKRDEHEYLVSVLRGGVRDAWDPTLVIAAAFMRVCEHRQAISARKRCACFANSMYWMRGSGNRCTKRSMRTSLGRTGAKN